MLALFLEKNKVQSVLGLNPAPLLTTGSGTLLLSFHLSGLSFLICKSDDLLGFFQT